MKDWITGGFVAVVKFIAISMAWNFLLFILGRVILLVVTLGRYPRRRAVENDENLIAVVGLVVLVGAWSVIAVYNHFGHVGHPY